MLKNAIEDFSRTSNGAVGYAVADMARWDTHRMNKRIDQIFDKLGIERQNYSNGSNKGSNNFLDNASSSSRSTTLLLRNVKNLFISDLLFLNPANHMINILDSENIVVTGITVFSYDCNNGDGVGLICSENALIYKPMYKKPICKFLLSVIENSTKEKLDVGTYTETITVETLEGTSVDISVSFTVTAAGCREKSFW